MLRITENISDAINGRPYRPFPGSILIWNLTNACNLECSHCYASSHRADKDELTLGEIKRLIPGLKEAAVRFAILSGGEPLLREDILDIARALREGGIKTYLSTNGLLIKDLSAIKDNFDYVGISIDGDEPTHDAFRRKKGAYRESMRAIMRCMDAGIKVGLRFTLTDKTLPSLRQVFGLVETEGIPKLYVSHLVYSGRGGGLTDLDIAAYRDSMAFIIGKSFEYVEGGRPITVVTGNNEADAAFLLMEFKKRYPEHYDKLRDRLRLWGGNQAGVRLLNMDFRGNVKPDPFFSDPIGNVRERDFMDIWRGNGILSRLREKPRKITGRCASCEYMDVCNGNSRARARAAHGDYFAEDPACYL